MSKAIRIDEGLVSFWNTGPDVDRIVFRESSVEEAIESPVMDVTDVSDEYLAGFGGLWLPERITVTSLG